MGLEYMSALIAKSAESEPAACSRRDLDAPMAGTADPVDLWLLLEAPGAWPARALERGPLAATEAAWLERQRQAPALQHLRVRPQLIKQLRPRADRRRVLLLGYAGRLYQQLGVDGLPLPELSALIAALEAGVMPAGLEVLAAPRYFVCTNGRRDLCCARYGMPVYRALRDRYGDRAWQVTHIGGHRFAGNVLTLPDGALYGRLHPQDCDGFAETIERGELAFSWLRGRSCYPPVVQAAEAMLGVQGLRLLHVDGDDQAAIVRFAGPAGEHSIALARSAEPQEVLAGCDKPALKATWPFERRGSAG